MTGAKPFLGATCNLLQKKTEPPSFYRYLLFIYTRRPAAITAIYFDNAATVRALLSIPEVDGFKRDQRAAHALAHCFFLEFSHFKNGEMQSREQGRKSKKGQSIRQGTKLISLGDDKSRAGSIGATDALTYNLFLWAQKKEHSVQWLEKVHGGRTQRA